MESTLSKQYQYLKNHDKITVNFDEIVKNYPDKVERRNEIALYFTGKINAMKQEKYSKILDVTTDENKKVKYLGSIDKLRQKIISRAEKLKGIQSYDVRIYKGNDAINYYRNTPTSKEVAFQQMIVDLTACITTLIELRTELACNVSKLNEEIKDIRNKITSGRTKDVDSITINIPSGLLKEDSKEIFKKKRLLLIKVFKYFLTKEFQEYKEKCKGKLNDKDLNEIFNKINGRLENIESVDNFDNLATKFVELARILIKLYVRNKNINLIIKKTKCSDKALIFELSSNLKAQKAFNLINLFDVIAEEFN